MRYTRFVHGSAAVTILAVLIGLSPANGMPTPQATAASTVFVPHCALIAATGEPSKSSTAPAETQVATAVTPASHLETATQEAGDAAPLEFINVEPFDVRFNPNPAKPFVVIMNFTLFFKNKLNTTLDVRSPKFQLSIEDVPWGNLTSTDFQMGKLQANARQGIVLQSLLIISKATDAQKAVLECVKVKAPVDLDLTGTIDAYPNDTQQTLTVHLVTKQVVLPSSN